MRHRRLFAVLAIVAAFVAAGVSSPVGAAGSGTNVALYAQPGPYPVGLLTLQLPDRTVSVFYPARPGSEAGQAEASYDQREPYPPDLQALVPPQYDTRISFAAYPALPGSPTGPFPVVLFSHGLGSFRLDNASLNAGVASWGFVVVSPEFPERDRAAVTRQSLSGPSSAQQSTPAQEAAQARGDADALLAALHLVETASQDPSSPLHGLVQANRVAAIGHSAGGGAALTLLPNPAVRTAIGWAPVGPARGTREPTKPTMIIAGLDDIAITPARVRALYATLKAPKRLVEIGNVGHNGFTDICIAIRQGGGLIEFARQHHLVPENLLALGENGCQQKNLDPREGFQVIQHFTVAQLRWALGINKTPVGLGPGVTRAFPGVSIQYQQQP